MHVVQTADKSMAVRAPAVSAYNASSKVPDWHQYIEKSNEMSFSAGLVQWLA